MASDRLLNLRIDCFLCSRYGPPIKAITASPYGSVGAIASSVVVMVLLLSVVCCCGPALVAVVPAVGVYIVGVVGVVGVFRSFVEEDVISRKGWRGGKYFRSQKVT